MKITIKQKHLESKVAFGGSAKKLKDRTDKELEQLALIARESNAPSKIDLFESLPTLEELRKAKIEAVLAPTPAINPADMSLVSGDTKAIDTKKP